MAKEILASSRKMKIRRVFTRFFLWLVFSAAVAGTLVGAFYYHKWRVQEIEVRGVEALKSEEVNVVVREELLRRIAYVLPGDNIVLLRTENLENELRHRLPRIKNVSVRRESLNKLSIEINERKTWGIYCHQEKCFLLDESGFVFSPSPAFEGSLIVKVIDRRTAGAVVGETVPTGNLELHALRLAFEEAARRSISEIVIHSADEWSLMTDADWRLFIDERIDLRSVVQNLRAVLADIGDKTATLDYIDLRYEKKIFYKFK